MQAAEKSTGYVEPHNIFDIMTAQEIFPLSGFFIQKPTFHPIPSLYPPNQQFETRPIGGANP